jgi:hypothetical protein
VADVEELDHDATVSGHQVLNAVAGMAALPASMAIAITRTATSKDAYMTVWLRRCRQPVDLMIPPFPAAAPPPYRSQALLEGCGRDSAYGKR